MSQRQVKKYKRLLKRGQNKIVVQYLQMIQKSSFKDRLIFAWELLTKTLV